MSETVSRSGWIPGDYHVICDVCGFQVRASQSRMRWDNLRVCTKDWEPRHPQEYVRGKPDRITVPNPRPPPPDVFVSPGDVTADDL
jgi:hypothetical protein